MKEGVTFILAVDLSLSSEHKLRYFWWNLRAFWPFIDSNATETFKVDKGSKDIIKIVLVSLLRAHFSLYFYKLISGLEVQYITSKLTVYL